MLAAGQNRPTAETQPYETRLSTFKVNELQTLLQHFKVQKIGKKNELYTRCVELLRTPNMTRAVIEKIREIETRVNQRVQPYPAPSLNHSYQQQQQNMYRPNGIGYNAYGGGMGGMGNMGGMGMHQSMNQIMSNVTPRPARNLTALPLPFYDPLHTLLEPQELPVSCNMGNKMQAQVTCQFSVIPEHHQKLSVRESEFPRTEVQLRFFNTTGDILNIEQPDDFPLNCNVRINDMVVSLPNVIPTNKPNVEPKRPSRPVNITQYVINQPSSKQHRMRVDWTADKRQWAVAIYLVTRVNADILKTRIVKSPSFELPYETTEATIRKRLGGGDDDDVSMDSLKISLLCPLMKTRMGIAARSRDCTHLQCFDLDSYLMLNEKKPAWKCGVCNNSAPYHKLIIDKYFMQMLKDLGPAVTDVELLKDGTYRVIKEDDTCDISDDDLDGPPKPKKAAPSVSSASSSRPSSNAAPAAPAAGGTAAKKPAAIDDDIITISDDDEEADMDLRKAILNSQLPESSKQQSPQHRTPVKTHASPSSDDSIIILDDTPPRPEPNRSTASASSGGAAGSSNSWRNTLSSSSAASSAAATPTSSAAAAAGSSTSVYQRNPTTLNDALAQCHMQGTPAPQSAPPMLSQQQQQANWNLALQNNFSGYYNVYDPRQQQQNNGFGNWVPPNGPQFYPQQPGGGVIRRHDDIPRDPREPR